MASKLTRLTHKIAIQLHLVYTPSYNDSSPDQWMSCEQHKSLVSYVSAYCIVASSLNEVPRHEDIRGSWGIAKHILNLDTRRWWMVSFMSRPIYPQGKEFPGIQRIGGWMCPRPGLKAVLKIKSHCPWWESNPGRPVHNPDTILNELYFFFVIMYIKLVLFFCLYYSHASLGYGLDDRGSMVRFQAGAGNFSFHHRVQNCSGAHPASYPMVTMGSFPGGKVAGSWSWPLTSIYCRGQRMSGAIHPLPPYAFMAWC
jgi:hypothetical protein